LIEDGISRVVAFSTVDAPFVTSCLSINTILTLRKSGVGVIVGVREGTAVAVAVAEGINVDVLEGKIFGVFETDTVVVAVLEGMAVGVLLAVEVAVLAGVREEVTVAVGVKVAVGVLVAVGGALVTVDVNSGSVCEGVEEITTVAVFIKGVVSTGVDVRVDAGDACSVWIFNKGASGGLGFENRE
jgi:hypothetical protein